MASGNNSNSCVVSINAADRGFVKESRITAETLISKKEEYVHITVAEMRVDKQDKKYIGHQRLYTSILANTD